MRRRAARAAVLPCWAAGGLALLVLPWQLVYSVAAVAAVSLAILARP